MPGLADVRNFLSTAKDGVVEAGSRTKNDTYRVASTTREALVTGSANTGGVTRRDVLKAIGASGGLVLTGAYGDEVYSKIEEAVPDDATKSDGAWYSGPDPLNLGDHRAAEGHETSAQGSESGNTSPDRIANYREFEKGLKSQSSQSLSYVEGALEADPGDVGDVSFESDGLYVDSILAEWDHPDMDQSMRNYLEKAEQSGDLEKWLSKYEKQNL